MPTRFWPTEVRSIIDPRSGRSLRQLTHHKCHSHHLYFTNPGWFDGGRRLLFGSDRLGKTNLYSVELASGAITQHSDADMPPPPAETSFLYASVNPLRPEAYFWRGNVLMAIDLVRNAERQIYKADARYLVNITNVTADGRYVCTAIYENLSDRLGAHSLVDAAGFKQMWGGKPESRLLAIPTDGGPAQELWHERSWIGHVNTSPTQPNVLTFCHEGPWDMVDNRIWGIDLRVGKPWAIRPRKVAGERIGHEYWHADGIHIGYHGYLPDGRKVMGRIKADNTAELEAEFPHHTGHIHSVGWDMIVGDGQGDVDHPVLRLWRWNGMEFDGPRVLCEHRSSFQVQQLHVHPRFSADGKKIVFTSDRTGYGQVYEIEVGNFETLPMLG